MREAWREPLFAEPQEAGDPVKPAERAAMRKATARTLDDGTAVHSFRSLMNELATIVRNVCRTGSRL